MADLGDTTVLIVEDNADMRQLLAHFLRLMKPGNILIASDGQAALDLLTGEKAASVGLLITDIQMPRMNGLALARNIRRGAAAVPADLPIIVISAMLDGRTRAAAEALDVDGVLPKPVGFPAFQAAVAAVVESRPRGRPAKDYGQVDLPDVG